MVTSYANNGGTGERRPEIIVSTNFTSSAGDLGGGAAITADDAGVFLDGVTASGGREFGNANNTADRNIQFDFGVGAVIVIDEFTLYVQSTTAFGTFTWEGSNNGSTWTTIGATFTGFTAGANVVARTNSTGYRYYRIHTTSFAGGAGGFWYEFEFKIQDTTPQASRTSWYNTGGKGVRGATITVTGGLTLATGTLSLVVDGDYTNNSSHAIGPTAGQTAADITFDFGAGATNVIIDTVLLWAGANPGNTHGTWKLQGSANGSSWTDIGATFSLMTIQNYLLTKHTVTNTTGYRYYRLLQTAGTTSALPNITEIEFRLMNAGGGGGGGGTAKTIVMVIAG